MLDLKPVHVPDDYDANQHDAPVVDPVADIPDADDQTLENKIKEYHDNAPFLAEHHNQMQDNLRISEGRFTKVSESIIMVQTLIEAAEAVAPNQELFVTAELFETTDAQEQALNWWTIGGSGVGLLTSIAALSRTVQIVEDLAPGAGTLARFMNKGKQIASGSKFVKFTRGLGVIGAGVSLGVGIAALNNVRVTQERRRTYLESLTQDYQAWWDATRSNYDTFKGARDDLEAEIAALQAELGYEPGSAGYDQMCADLAGNIQKLGELTARLETLERLLCKSGDVLTDDDDVAKIVRLPRSTVEAKRADFFPGSTACQALDPPVRMAAMATES